MRSILKTVYRLANSVQVRKESWGLLFYSQTRHRLFFVRSKDWLSTTFFDGTWDSTGIIEDVSKRTGISPQSVERTLQKVTRSLLQNGMITHELC